MKIVFDIPQCVCLIFPAVTQTTRRRKQSSRLVMRGRHLPMQWAPKLFLRPFNQIFLLIMTSVGSIHFVAGGCKLDFPHALFQHICRRWCAKCKLVWGRWRTRMFYVHSWVCLNAPKKDFVPSTTERYPYAHSFKTQKSTGSFKFSVCDFGFQQVQNDRGVWMCGSCTGHILPHLPNLCHFPITNPKEGAEGLSATDLFSLF